MNSHSRKIIKTGRSIRHSQRDGQVNFSVMVVTDKIVQVNGRRGKRTYMRRAPSNTQRRQYSYLRRHRLLKDDNGATMQFMHRLWRAEELKKKKEKLKKYLFSRGK